MKTPRTTAAITLAILACTVAVTLTTGCVFKKKDAITKAAETQTDKPGILETKDIAAQGFIYGLPIVMNYAVMYEYCVDTNSSQFKAPFNQIKNDTRIFTYEDTNVLAPNCDISYSMVWLDLRAEPIILSVPAVEKKRYYSVMLCDGNSFNYGYIGTRMTGNGAGDYMVAGPNWKGKTPRGIKKIFQSSTEFSAVAYRTQLYNAQDMSNVVKVQAGYKVQPLSTYLHQPAPAAPPAIDFPKISDDTLETNFFQYLDFALQFAPPGPEEKEIRAKLGRIGIGAGRTFNYEDLDIAHKLEVHLGMNEAQTKINLYLTNDLPRINGWTVANLFGNRDFYHGDWMLRAAAAATGIYGNDSAEAVFPNTSALASGEALDGGHKYTLTFGETIGFPRVNAFWSLTIYDGRTQLLAKNPIDRYLINSSMLSGLKTNADGSLTIYIQHDSPGADKESNWLPAPSSPLYLVMRLYWPKAEVPSILPPGEGTWKPPAIEKAD